jgi:hypothetical protein
VVTQPTGSRALRHAFRNQNVRPAPAAPEPSSRDRQAACRSPVGARLVEKERARLMRRMSEIVDSPEGWLVEVAVLNRVMCEVGRHPRS